MRSPWSTRQECDGLWQAGSPLHLLDVWGSHARHGPSVSALSHASSHFSMVSCWFVGPSCDRQARHQLPSTQPTFVLLKGNSISSLPWCSCVSLCSHLSASAFPESKSDWWGSVRYTSSHRTSWRESGCQVMAPFLLTVTFKYKVTYSELQHYLVGTQIFSIPKAMCLTPCFTASPRVLAAQPGRQFQSYWHQDEWFLVLPIFSGSHVVLLKAVVAGVLSSL